MEKKEKRKISIYWIILLSFIILIFIIYLLSFIPAFSNFYRKYIYPIWLNSYGRISSILPFSYGEFLFTILFILIIIFIISSIVLIFKRKAPRYKKIYGLIFKKTLMFLVVFLLLDIMVSAPFSRSDRISTSLKKEKREYTVEELLILRDYLYKEANELSLKIDRDEKGLAIYNQDYVLNSKKAINNLQDEFPLLKGYIPSAKPLLYSRLQTYLQTMGVTYYSSLSVNYNKDLYICSIPATITHEYAHIKGYIKEDEANFIGYLSCVKYDDVFFKYSGYLSVLDYVNYDYYISSKENYVSPLENKYVKQDKASFDPLVEEEIKNSPINSEVIGDISSTITDISIKANGDKGGIATYSYVVSLLLQYYDGILY